jgi:hypothetical protein
MQRRPTRPHAEIKVGSGLAVGVVRGVGERGREDGVGAGLRGRFDLFELAPVQRPVDAARGARDAQLLGVSPRPSRQAAMIEYSHRGSMPASED